MLWSRSSIQFLDHLAYMLENVVAFTAGDEFDVIDVGKTIRNHVLLGLYRGQLWVFTGWGDDFDGSWEEGYAWVVKGAFLREPPVALEGKSCK